MNPPAPAGLLFDLDGTLVDTEPANAAASVRVFRELCGAAVRAEDFRPFVGTGDRRYLQGVAERYGLSIDLDRAVELRERYIREIAAAEGLKPFPGMAEVLRAARGRPGVKSAVVTSGNREKSRLLLTAAGFDPGGFDAWVTVEDAARPKPEPDLFLEAARRLGIPPARCVVVEDAPAGVEAARRAGMRCVAVAQTAPAERLTGADRVVARIDDVGIDRMLALAAEGPFRGNPA